MHIIYELALIFAGFILAVNTLDKWEGKSQVFSKIAKSLKPFSTIIGGICLIIGIWFIFRPFCTLRDLVSILAGLTLLGGTLENHQVLHDFFNKAAGFLNPYRVVIGLIALVLGLLGIFNVAFIC